MHDILSRQGITLYGQGPLALRLAYAAQLEASGQLKPALYVILTGEDDPTDCIRHVLLDMLIRNWPQTVGARRDGNGH